jgi:hypothetical protein
MLVRPTKTAERGCSLSHGYLPTSNCKVPSTYV